jgi:hypothetical protein
MSSNTSSRGTWSVYDGTFFPGANVSFPDGSLAVVNGIRNTVTDTVVAYLNSNAPVSSTDTTTGTLRNFGTLRIGAQFNGVFADAEIYAAAVFRTVLTAAQARQVANYFANREAYL